MDVGLKDLSGQRLETQREVAAPATPQGMRQTIGLDRVKPLEIKGRLQQSIAGGVAVEHGEQVRANCCAYRWVAGHVFGESLANDRIGRLRALQALRNPVATTPSTLS